MSLELNLQIPEKFIPLFKSKKRYNVLYGGRGSGKSWTVAEFLVLKAYQSKCLVLCGREIQNSIKDSVHKLLSDTIDKFKFNAFFDIQRDQIIGHNGSKFIFKGLRHSVAEVKSTEGITDCWVEEAQSVSNDSWDILIPTVRQPGSQFYITFNPDEETDPTYERFVTTKRDDVLLINVNYNDNPFFPDVLRAEMEFDRKNNYDKYLWIWEGLPRKISDALVFKGRFFVEEFETPPLSTEITAEQKKAEVKTNDAFYFGADWGFAEDPTVLVRNFIVDNTLYIDYEAYGIGVKIKDIKTLFDKVPLSRKYSIRCDSARPETIDYVRDDGFKATAAFKGPGSIEDGIEHLKSFDKIIIHPRCKHTIDEFKSYKYKQDSKTNTVLPILIDKHNHLIDSIRYSQELVRRKRKKPSGNLRKLGV